MAEYKVGDRVRITRVYEGVVTSESETFIGIDGSLVVKSPRFSSSTVEVLEPEYEIGAAYIDANDEHWLWNGVQWYAFGVALPFKAHEPDRPLRKLVPEGE